MSTVTQGRRTEEMRTAPLEPTSSHPYTCNTCQVAFRNSDLQRGHMRSDWHRYNLKRRVTSLPPITSEVFTEKVLAAQASSKAAASKASYEKVCIACAKTYFSENAYNNHLGSQRHRTRVAMLKGGTISQMDEDNNSIQSSQSSQEQPTQHGSESDEDVDEVAGEIERASLNDGADNLNHNSHLASNAETTSSSENPSGIPGSTDINPQQCLFCNYDSPSFALNVVHMERIHGMFIPERQYLVDLEGLIHSLHEKIYEFHECLYCGKLKPSVFGLQTHMRDKGHCKIRFDTEDEQLEIGEFYDFSNTYSDVEDDLWEDEMPGKEQSSSVKLRTRSGNVRDREEEMEDADGWETDSSASSLDSADLTAVPLDQHIHQYEKLNRHPHHSHVDPRPHHNRDGWHSHAHKHAHAVFYSDYELHLPSGRAVGHRSLNKYYRQNLHNHPSPSERQEQYAIEAAARSDEDNEDSLINRNTGGERGRALTSRANGGLGMIGVTEQKKREVLATEKRARKVEERQRRRFQWGNNKQSNSQKHFRDPLLQ